MGRRSWWWTLAVAALLAWSAAELSAPLRLNSDLLALLPGSGADPALDRALRRFADGIGSHLMLLVGAGDFDDARSGAEKLAENLRKSPAFSDVRVDLDQNWLAQAMSAYQPYRDGLLSGAARQALQQGQGESLLAQARQALYTPAAFLRRTRPGEDPLNVFGGFSPRRRPATGKLNLRDDVLTVTREGRHYVLIDARLGGDPLRVPSRRRRPRRWNRRSRRHALQALASQNPACCSTQWRRRAWHVTK